MAESIFDMQDSKYGLDLLSDEELIKVVERLEKTYYKTIGSQIEPFARDDYYSGLNYATKARGLHVPNTRIDTMAFTIGPVKNPVPFMYQSKISAEDMLKSRKRSLKQKIEAVIERFLYWLLDKLERED